MASTSAHEPLTFSQLKQLTNGVISLYQFNEGLPAFLAYFDDMRVASSLHRRDNINTPHILKVTELAAVAHMLHKHNMGMTNAIAGLLDIDALQASHPGITTGIRDLNDSVMAWRRHVKMFGSPDAIPETARDEIDAKASAAIKAVTPLRGMRIPIRSGDLTGYIARDSRRDKTPLYEAPGVLLVAFAQGLKGGITDKHRSPPSVRHFFKLTIGQGVDTAESRETLAATLRKGLAKPPNTLRQTDIDTMVPDRLSQAGTDEIFASLEALTPRKANFLLFYNTLNPVADSDLLMDCIRTKLSEKKALINPMRIRPETPQEMLIILFSFAPLAFQDPDSLIGVNDRLAALDGPFSHATDPALLGAMVKTPEYAGILERARPHVKPFSPHSRVMQYLENLPVPKDAGEKPKRTR